MRFFSILGASGIVASWLRIAFDIRNRNAAFMPPCFFTYCVDLKSGLSCATIVCWEGVGEVVLACGSGVGFVQERQCFVRGLFAV